MSYPDNALIGPRFDLGDPDRDFGFSDHAAGPAEYLPPDPHPFDDPDDEADNPEMEGAATMGNYSNPTANAVDTAVQASKQNGNLRAADRKLMEARLAYDKAKAEFASASAPIAPGATNGLRKLRLVADASESGGKWAIGLLKDLSVEEFAAIKPHLATLDGRTAKGGW